MLTNTPHRLIFAVAAACLFFLNSAHANDPQLVPPKLNFVDKNGVSATSRSVSVSIDTVSIGGAMGLSHHVGMYSNSLVRMKKSDWYTPWVADILFTDKYRGMAHYDHGFTVDENFRCPGAITNYDDSCLGNFKRYDRPSFYIMTVQDDESSQQFYVQPTSGGGSLLQNSTLPDGLFKYVPLDASAHRLEPAPGNPTQLIWWQPSGKKVIYNRAGQNAGSTGFLSRIEYPNGFTIRVERASILTNDVNRFNSRTTSVYTNTGFQLKYNYHFKNVPAENVTRTTVQDAMGAPWPATGLWAATNPSEVIALNNRDEICNDSYKQICTKVCPSPLIDGQQCQQPVNTWPNATFELPQGMPNVIFTSPTAHIKVTNAKKGVTLLRSTAVNISNTPNFPQYRPVLAGITYPGATAESVTYTHGGPGMTDEFNRGYSLKEVVAANGIKGETRTVSYDNQWHTVTTSYSDDIVVTLDNTRYGWVGSATNKEGYAVFKNGAYITETSLIDEPKKQYDYDGRNNVKEIRTLNANGTTYASVVATYADTCTNDTFKTCNKPKTIKDNNGNITTYTYHLPSGQVESVTSPSVSGKQAQTRYEYTAKTASASQIANTPIYLKTKESYCINSNFSGVGDGYSRFSGSCAGGDEVVTQYEYEPANLLLTGTIVTADGKSLRTCYSYDQYGNQIGKTLPKALLLSCP